jgi:hypothetical protein
MDSSTIVFIVTKKDFVAFRVPPELKSQIQEIADNEARSISQVCELLLAEGVETYKRDGPKFMQRLVAKQKPRVK